MQFKAYDPILSPGLPFAVHAVNPTQSSPEPSPPSQVKVVGFLCSRRKRPRSEMGGETERQVKDVEGKSAPVTQTHTGARTIYVRMQFSKSLMVTLPLEVAREKYPQILIDYLLTTAMWC